ncbi:MAG: RluA family pseudouridine synthase [Candidatus Omnitrophota bacterium]|jgi:RluA family pseudouridine synthase
MKVFIVAERSRMLEYLLKMMPEYKRNKVKSFLIYKSVSVNGVTRTKHDHFLARGDKVTIRTSEKEARQAERRYSIRIVYEDKDIFVIDKPAGLLTIATEKIKTKTAYYELTDYAKLADPSGKGRVFIVHRLDRDTSGLLVFARNEDGKRKLQGNWEKAEKKYLAVVDGVPSKASDIIRSYLIESKFHKVYSGPKTAESKLAVTRYKILRSNGKHSLLEVILETGRKNQIRVHMSDIGHPVSGDEKYGSSTDLSGRIALHASHLAFDHPATGKRMVFESPIPDSMSSIFRCISSKPFVRKKG